MVVTRASSMAGGGINLLEWTVNPFQSSEVSKLQDFYWLTYEDLFDGSAMEQKSVPKDKIEYILENRDVQFIKKPTKGYELRKGVMDSKKFKQLQDFYGFSLDDTQDIELLRKKGVADEDIEFITGKTLTKPKPKPTPKYAEVEADDTQVVDTDDLRTQYKAKFGKFPSKMMKTETLKKKLWLI